MRPAFSRGLAVILLAAGLTGCMPASDLHPAALPARPARPEAPAAGPPDVGEAAPQHTLSAVKVTAPAPPATDLWQQLRDSFVMEDCGGADPQPVLHWARLFTESPGHFEASLQRALPSLRYIQQIARQREIPGEFVLLPWVESHYLPVFSRRDRPVGMWQIMPDTARSLGLRVGHHYDARLDTAATTEAIFDLIAQYYEQYHDWRLADYAFNSGTGTVNRLLQREGSAAAGIDPAALPIHRTTREHLLKLMAIACVIRDPARFGVQLPRLPATERLEPVLIPRAMPVALAAAKAGLPADRLAQLNSAFLDGTIDPRHSETLLLPRANVQHWYDTQIPAAEAAAALRSSPGRNTGPVRRPRRYTVRHGDSLSLIAERHHLSQRQLIRWNRLGRRPLRPGQVLKLEPGDD